MKTITCNKITLRKLHDKEILDDDEITTHLLCKKIAKTLIPIDQYSKLKMKQI